MYDSSKKNPTCFRVGLEITGLRIFAELQLKQETLQVYWLQNCLAALR